MSMCLICCKEDDNCTCPLDDEAICMVDSIARLIQDDSWACTFQTMGQYRTALLYAIHEAKEKR